MTTDFSFGGFPLKKSVVIRFYRFKSVAKQFVLLR